MTPSPTPIALAALLTESNLVDSMPSEETNNALLSAKGFMNSLNSL